MGYKIKICCGLDDSKRNTIPPNGYLPDDFIPRVGDTLILGNLF